MVEIRKATENDTHYIYELNKYELGYEYSEEKTKERLKFIINRETDKIWVACDGDLIVGYIHGADYECTYSDSLKNIMAIAVDEKYRGRGIGKQLLMTVEQWAEDNNCIGVRLVSSFNREKAHQFYFQCGYTNRKDQKNFIKIFTRKGK